MNFENKKILVTGCAGFIGAALSKRLLKLNTDVCGIDNLNSYYDENLKKDRLKDIEHANDLLKKTHYWKFFNIGIENDKLVKSIFNDFKPEVVIHLAAQAGVRYSLINPNAYLISNILGFGNILENCKEFNIKNLIYASSSSVYGANKIEPFKEDHEVNHPLSLYAATKRSNELMAHTYSHLYELPTIGLRFFTVYGPWGRPDMAPMIFTNAILNDQEIEVFNNGLMKRDFTYIDDVVESILRCIDKPPLSLKSNENIYSPSKSKAPFKIFNIGSSNPTELMKFINLLEDILGKKAKINYLPLQSGDVISTFSDSTNLIKYIDFNPETNMKVGLKNFVDWYKNYYKY